VIASDENDGRFGERFAQALKLTKREHNRCIGGPNGMKEIARDHHRIGPGGDDAIDRAPKCLGDVGFTLIDAGWGLPVVLPNSEVRIGDMSQFHGWRMDLNALKSKNL
jgi:hypothetical protein